MNKNTICNKCFGCNQLENKNFIGYTDEKQCSSYIPAVKTAKQYIQDCWKVLKGEQQKI